VKVTLAGATVPSEPSMAHAHVEIDLDDMFGLREAMATLSEDARDTFVERWVELVGESHEDVRLLSIAAMYEARSASPPELARAWRSVADSMRRYVAWRLGTSVSTR
jgi:hypothetical protein